VLITTVAVIAVIAIAFLVWANAVMQGERPAALRAWTNPAVSITSTDHSVIMKPRSGGSLTGLVFIPGAKVDPYAYLDKLSGAVANSGVTVVITEPTLNLAFFDTRQLSTFTHDAPGVSRWYVGGHSLGGVRACQLADSPTVTGLVLFGSYCANDLSGSSLRVLSISGSDDGLSTPAKITDTAHLLPPTMTFVQIDGADHASFGDYGAQPGDGTATLTSQQVQRRLTKAFAEFFG
jgi:hypothetical protein